MYGLLQENLGTQSRVCGVYCFIHRDSGRCYVGSSIDIYSRRKVHICNSRNSGVTCFNNAMRKYGVEAFDFEIIERCLPEMRFDREEFWIKFYDSAGVNGFNTKKETVGLFRFNHEQASKKIEFL